MSRRRERRRPRPDGRLPADLVRQFEEQRVRIYWNPARRWWEAPSEIYTPADEMVEVFSALGVQRSIEEGGGYLVVDELRTVDDVRTLLSCLLGTGRRFAGVLHVSTLYQGVDGEDVAIGDDGVYVPDGPGERLVRVRPWGVEADDGEGDDESS